MPSSIITAPAKIPKANLLQRILGFNRRPHLRLYHSYGDLDRVLVLGHALSHPPLQPEKFRSGLYYNTISLLRMFAIRPIPNTPVRIMLGAETYEVTTDENGFFAAEWQSDVSFKEVWQEVSAELLAYPGVSATGKIYIPQTAPFAVISDVDDTFLISHSGSFLLRLKELLTQNARTRRAFPGVVEHYQALALAQTTPNKPNPFFYVSSSEWNLYDYLKEFCRWHGMPEGVFLLSSMKRLKSFWNTGGNNHDGKFTRIARIMDEFPQQRYVLIGDDSQRDPMIYAELVQKFPGRIICVYIRQRVKSNQDATRICERQIKSTGTEVCYFTHSHTALQHSRDFGLIPHQASKF